MHSLVGAWVFIDAKPIKCSIKSAVNQPSHNTTLVVQQAYALLTNIKSVKMQMNEPMVKISLLGLGKFH